MTEKGSFRTPIWPMILKVVANTLVQKSLIVIILTLNTIINLFSSCHVNISFFFCFRIVSGSQPVAGDLVSRR